MLDDTNSIYRGQRIENLLSTFVLCATFEALCKRTLCNECVFDAVDAAFQQPYGWPVVLFVVLSGCEETSLSASACVFAVSRCHDLGTFAMGCLCCCVVASLRMIGAVVIVAVKKSL